MRVPELSSIGAIVCYYTALVSVVTKMFTLAMIVNYYVLLIVLIEIDFKILDSKIVFLLPISGLFVRVTSSILSVCVDAKDCIERC